VALHGISLGVRLSPRLLGKPLALAVALMGLGGCGAAPEQPHVEVAARQQVAVPVCSLQLAPAKRGSGARVRSMDPEQWMGVLAPRYTPEQGLGPTDLDCTGHYLFANESLRGGISQRGWPRQVDPEDLDVRVGPQGTRVLWLRLLKFENGDEGGPIALVRVGADRAEVVAIGSFRGPSASELSPVRLGNELIVSAESKVCPAPEDCQKRAQFYLARRGRLIASASVDLERTAVLPSVTERGLYARYVLRTEVTYKPTGIQLLEHVEVKIVHSDVATRDSDRALRKVEFSRFLRVERDALFSSNDPLWERVVGQD
jgi:hypothetical protein